MEIRCPHKKHAELVGSCSGVLEIQCHSRFCGHRSGVMILHHWDMTTGSLLMTRSLRNPRTTEQQLNHRQSNNSMPGGAQ